MRDLTELNNYRDHEWEGLMTQGYGNDEPGKQGCFRVNTIDGTLRILASAGGNWDHLSVSLESRCPTWEEMEHVAKLFFKPDETAVQYHVPESEHVNYHPFCLHWWRPQARQLFKPPQWMVGPKP